MINPLQKESIIKWIIDDDLLEKKYTKRSRVIKEIIQKAYQSRILSSINLINFQKQDENNLIFFYSKTLFKKAELFFSNSPKVQV